MRNRGLGFWLSKRRLKNPDKTAVVFGDDELTYRQLADDTDKIAAVLDRRPDSRVVRSTSAWNAPRPGARSGSRSAVVRRSR